MLKFNRTPDSDKLSDQFGIPEDRFNAIADRWKECFDEIDAAIEKSVNINPEEEGVEFDATIPMEIFFKHFNTQELQDIAMVQFVMRDCNRRANQAIGEVLRKQFGQMMEEFAKAAEEGRDNDKGGFEEDLL